MFAEGSKIFALNKSTQLSLQSANLFAATAATINEEERPTKEAK
jgi:hypothetical protein